MHVVSSQRTFTQSLANFANTIQLLNSPTEFGGGINTRTFRIGAPNLRTSWDVQIVTVSVDEIIFGEIKGIAVGPYNQLLEIILLAGTQPVSVTLLNFLISAEELAGGGELKISRQKTITLELYAPLQLLKAEDLSIAFSNPRKSPAKESTPKTWELTLVNTRVNVTVQQSFPA